MKEQTKIENSTFVSQYSFATIKMDSKGRNVLSMIKINKMLLLLIW